MPSLLAQSAAHVIFVPFEIEHFLSLAKPLPKGSDIFVVWFLDYLYCKFTASIFQFCNSEAMSLLQKAGPDCTGFSACLRGVTQVLLDLVLMSPNYWAFICISNLRLASVIIFHSEIVRGHEFQENFESPASCLVNTCLSSRAATYMWHSWHLYICIQMEIEARFANKRSQSHEQSEVIMLQILLGLHATSLCSSPTWRHWKLIASFVFKFSILNLFPGRYGSKGTA